MKKVISLLVVILIGISTSFASGKYSVNQTQIDDLFSNAVEIQSNHDFMTGDIEGINMSNAQLTDGAKNPWVALALCWVVGCFGIHRMYLGTDMPKVLFLYLCTGGGCGVVVAVDWVILIMAAINNDISPYVDNPKFIMWM